MTERFYYLSDIHNEFRKHDKDDVGRVFDITSCSGGKDDSLILAGDIDQLRSGSKNISPTLVTLLKNACNKFKYIFYVLGNHEYYSSPVNDSGRKIQRLKDLVACDNLIILNKDTFVFNDIAVIGATLWTDIDNNSQFLKTELEDRYNGFSDFKKIKYKIGNRYRKLKVSDIFSINLVERNYIFSEIKKYKKLGYKTVVISHHPPTTRVYDSEYFKRVICNDYEDLLIKYQPDFWIHGHIHSKISYIVGDKTCVLANTLGYNDKEEYVEGFDIDAHFDVVNDENLYKPTHLFSDEKIDEELKALTNKENL